MNEMFNLEAERCVLGCAMLDERAAKLVAGHMSPSTFYSPSHSEVMSAIAELVAESKPVDLVTVKDMLQRKLDQHGKTALERIGGTDYLIQIAESVPSTANLKGYASIVREHWVKRELLRRMKETAKLLPGETGLKEAFRFVRECGRGLADSLTVDYSINDILDEIDAEDSTPDHKFGIPSGLRWFDRAVVTKGLPIGEPVIITAPSGKGKSALATQIALHLIRHGMNVGFATYEMTPKWLMRRFLQHIGGWATKPIDVTAQIDYENAKAELRDPMIGSCRFFDPSSIDELTSTVESLVRWHEASNEVEHVDCLIVDYAQLVGSERSFRSPVEELTHVTRCIGKTIKRTKSACLILSQQNAEGDTSGSKELIKIAAAILQINDAQDCITIKKSRHGKGGYSVPVLFSERYLTFEEIAR